jgi:hypothetical protein
MWLTQFLPFVFSTTIRECKTFHPTLHSSVQFPTSYHYNPSKFGQPLLLGSFNLLCYSSIKEKLHTHTHTHTHTYIYIYIYRYMLWLLSNLMHKILIYLHILNLLKSSTCFEHHPAHLQEVQVVIVYLQPLVSSLSAGDCLVHRLRKLFLNRCTRQYNYDVELLKMSRVMLEICRGI